jgi:hypothetical protein
MDRRNAMRLMAATVVSGSASGCAAPVVVVVAVKVSIAVVTTATVAATALVILFTTKTGEKQKLDAHLDQAKAEKLKSKGSKLIIEDADGVRHEVPFTISPATSS